MCFIRLKVNLNEKIPTWTQKTHGLQQNLVRYSQFVRLQPNNHLHTFSSEFWARESFDEINVYYNPRVLIIVNTLIDIHGVIEGQHQVFTL